MAFVQYIVFAKAPPCSGTPDLHSRLLSAVPTLALRPGLFVLPRVGLLQSPGRLLGSEWASC